MRLRLIALAAAIATAASQRMPEASAALLSELERADVLPETAMPTDVVRIGSIVIRVDDLARQTAFWSAALDHEMPAEQCIQTRADLGSVAGGLRSRDLPPERNDQGQGQAGHVRPARHRLGGPRTEHPRRRVNPVAVTIEEIAGWLREARSVVVLRRAPA